MDIKPGYWRVNDRSDNIVECHNLPDNCLGGKGNSTCFKGHLGALCEACDIN